MKKIFQPTKCLSQKEMEHYVKGDISDELRYTIENHLVDCPLCSEAMEGYQLMEGDSTVVFDDLFERIDAKVTAPETKAKTRSIPWNSIAAGLLFLISVSAAYVYYQNTNASNKYMAYFEQNDNALSTRSIDATNLTADLKGGYHLYQDKNYQGSLSFFEDYLKVNPESTTAAYYAGMSALEIGEEESAIDFLTTVRMNDDRLYEEASWRLAGIYLERGSEDKAKALLEDLVKVNNGVYFEQAKELLKEISAGSI